MTDHGFAISSDEAQERLGELLDRLASRGVSVDAYLVGSVAVAIQLGHNRVTPDIDGWFAPYDEVRAEAQKMADEYGLDPEWINQRALAFMEHGRDDDPDARVVEIHGRPVLVASKEALLAMKLAAYRPKDRQDVAALIQQTGIRDAGSLVALMRRFHAEESVVISNDDEELNLIAAEALRLAAARETAGTSAAPLPSQQGRVPRGVPSGGQWMSRQRPEGEAHL